MKKGKFNIVIGGQAGSESKGKLSAWLCDKYKPELVVMTASPNAGHTLVLPSGEKKVSYHLPIGALMCDAPIVLGPASLINPEIFKRELEALDIPRGRVTLDPRASIITSGHIWSEKQGNLSNIGSTLQGISECRISKMRRVYMSHTFARHISDYLKDLGVKLEYASPIINAYLNSGCSVLCEATQGFDLDLEHGIDRIHCTSKMINPAMVMAEAGVSPKMVGTIYGVIRPYPIRVNNRTGSSGPYTGSVEITWEEVARRCGFPGDPADFGEITTTTKLPRRVFEFSRLRFSRFLQVCRPDVLCLQFANYIDWSIWKKGDRKDIPSAVWDFIRSLDSGDKIRYIGTGPGHNYMIDLEE